ncbi:hypothetical protein [Anoxybacillus kestanbolensis]
MIRGKKASFIVAVIFMFVAAAQILDRNFLAIFPFFCGIYFLLQGFRDNK